MEFNDLLQRKKIDPKTVLVLRHSPKEPELFRVMHWLITDRPSTFNAYQQTQTPRVEKQMSRAKFVAAFFGHDLDKAAFVGLYEMKGNHLVTQTQLQKNPAHRELLKYAHDDSGPKRLWFDLVRTDFYADWQGKLIIRWPTPALVLSRWADKNAFKVDSIRDESVFASELANWRELVFFWNDLQLIPQRWKDELSRWRGVYFIWDSKDRKGYVGSATGKEGLYGRWRRCSYGGLVCWALAIVEGLPLVQR